MLDSTIHEIQDLLMPAGPVPLTFVGTLYGTAIPHMVLRSTVSFRLFAIQSLQEFHILAGLLRKE